MYYSASKGMTVYIVTAGTIILFAFLGYKSVMGLMHSQGSITPILIHSSILVSFAGIIALCFLYAPRGYSLSDNRLLIHRPISDITIPLDSIREVRVVEKPELRGMIRTFGVGGLFGNYGKFYTSTLGNVTMYATQSRNYVLIKTNRGKILITPDDLSMVERLRE